MSAYVTHTSEVLLVRKCSCVSGLSCDWEVMVSIQYFVYRLKQWTSRVAL